MRLLPTLAGFGAIGAVIAASGAAWGWHALTSDIARAEGTRIGWVGCIRTPDPELDWTAPARRETLWRALEAPDWALPGRHGVVWRSASYFLMKTARPDDGPRVVRAALDGHVQARIAAVHLAASWLQQPEVVPPEARELLGRGEAEGALAALALSVYTGLGIEPLERFQRRESYATVHRILHVDWRPTFGKTREELVTAWREWIAGERDHTLAELHRAALLELVRDLYRSDERFLMFRLLGVDGRQSWHDAVGFRLLDRADRSATAGLRALEDCLEGSEPFALDPNALTALFSYTYGGF